MELRGVIPPLVTPVESRRGDVDVESLSALTTHLEASGVHGLFPGGTIGEFSGLSRRQRETLVRTVVRASSDAPVLVGCGGTSLGDVDAYIEDAKAAGGDVAVVVTPYYVETSQAELCRFYEQVADRADLPVVLYNIPQRTGNHLTSESVSRLATHANIVGLKDTSRDFGFFADLRERTPDSFQLLMGSPALSIPALEIGADGLVSSPSNLIPRETTAIYEACQADDRERALELFHTTLLPIINASRSLPTIAVVKYLLARQGWDVGDPVMPHPTLSGDQRARLDETYQAVSANQVE